MSIRTILVASMLASLGAIVGPESAVFAQPVLPPPPAPMFEPEPAQAPPAPSYNPEPQPAQVYPPQQPAQAYPPPAEPYPAPQQQPAPAYPPPQQPATGYPQPGQGYPPPQPQGYPPPQPQGYPPSQPQGYPPPQPQGYPPPQPQGYPPPQQDYPPAPAQPAPKSESVFANPLSKLQVGFHLATGSIDTPDDPIRKSDFSGLGIFARYRFNQRWEAELAVASESGTIESNRAKREFTPITASGLWHVFDLRGVDLYARFGLGRSTEVYDHPDFKALEAPTTHFHLGAGASYIFRRNIGAGVEIRQQWINRSGTESIEELGGRGMTYSLVGSYHFK